MLSYNSSSKDPINDKYYTYVHKSAHNSTDNKIFFGYDLNKSLIFIRSKIPKQIIYLLK